MEKTQKKAARLLAQHEAAKDTKQDDHTTKQANLQGHTYAPTPGEIAYVAWCGAGYGIVVSPRRYSPRGIWYADELPGRWDTEAEAQRALDDLADQEGWRYTRLDQEGVRA